MIGVFWFLAAIQILLGLFSVRQGAAWRRAALRGNHAPPRNFTPSVAVFCPCRGLEEGLQENLATLAAFDYPEYEVLYVTASGADPACRVIQELAARFPQRARHVVAGSPVDCSEKVNNLRAAVEAAGSRFEVLVFADSDGRPGKNWLRQLVAPLVDEEAGAATTFRWILPVAGDGGNRLAGAMASAWNAAIVTLLGEGQRNFCWGGGTAIRRQTFHDARVPEFWRGAVSDDWALTRALWVAGKRIIFMPQCLTASPQHFSLRSLLEFTNRQMILTRVYSPRLWAVGALAHVYYALTLLFGILLSFHLAMGGHLWTWQWTWPAIAVLVFMALAAVKGWQRETAVRELLPEWSEPPHQWFWAGVWLAPLVPFLYSLNFAVSSVSRKIRWRGICYELKGPNETVILGEEKNAAPCTSASGRRP